MTNKIVFQAFEFYFGSSDHIYASALVNGDEKTTNFLVDTGFTLGIALDKKLMTQYQLHDGYLVNLILGNGWVTKGFAFITELIITHDGGEVDLGTISVIFTNKPGEPLIGIEALKLLSPIHLDWEQRIINIAD